MDFFGGAITLDFEKDGSRLCAAASWYSHSVSNEIDFQRCELPFGLDWNVQFNEIESLFGPPKGQKGRLIWFEGVCEYEVRFLFSDDGTLYSLTVDASPYASFVHEPGLIEKLFKLVFRR